MADSTINGLSAGAAVSATDEVPAWQGSTVKITAAQIKTFTSASPTLVTPNIDVATATSVNKVAITAPATSATLTIADGITLTCNASVTIAAQPPILGANTFTALQTITQASANAGILASTGYSLTGSDATSMVDLAGTLNTTGNPIALKIALTNTASGATTKFASFLAGAAGATEVFSVDKDGVILSTKNGSHALGITASGQNFVGLGRNSSVGGLQLFDGVGAASDTNAAVALTLGKLVFQSTEVVGWAASNVTQSQDLMLVRSAAAVLQQGAANAASPVAQTLQAQGSRSGTDANVGGANYTIQPGTGTGTGTLSSLILKSPGAVASGTGAQTQTTGLTIKAGTAVMTSYTVTNLPAAATAGAGAIAFVTDATATTPRSTVAGGGANKVLCMSDATNWLIVA